MDNETVYESHVDVAGDLGWHLWTLNTDGPILDLDENLRWCGRNRWTDPLRLDTGLGEVRMPVEGKEGIRDERAAELFRGIQAAGCGRAFESGGKFGATEPTVRGVLGVNPALEEALRGGRAD